MASRWKNSKNMHMHPGVIESGLQNGRAFEGTISCLILVLFNPFLRDLFRSVSCLYLISWHASLLVILSVVWF
jgi:hypothetical protein